MTHDSSIHWSNTQPVKRHKLIVTVGRQLRKLSSMTARPVTKKYIAILYECFWPLRLQLRDNHRWNGHLTAQGHRTPRQQPRLSIRIYYRSFSTIDNQVCCLPWFFSDCACDNLDSRSSRLGASSSSLCAVFCGTGACMPRCQVSNSGLRRPIVSPNGSTTSYETGRNAVM